MKQSLLLALTGMILLSGCYCKKYARGYSSVRELKSAHDYYICYQPSGMKDGKKILTTIYVGDPLLKKLDFWNHQSDGITSDIYYVPQLFYGARMEFLLKLGAFPGPMLGIGLDYSRGVFSTHYHTVIHSVMETQTQKVQQQRLHLSLNLITWTRERMMGYLGFRPGMEWTKRKIESDFVQYNSVGKYQGKFNFRIAYGFQFYLRPGLALHLEAGYGGGSIVQGGLSWWM